MKEEETHVRKAVNTKLKKKRKKKRKKERRENCKIEGKERRKNNVKMKYCQGDDNVNRDKKEHK